MNKKDSLGDRMKRYEQSSHLFLTRRTPVIIRIDGKAHHTFTRGLNKPFDDVYIHCMQQTMQYLCESIQGCVLGYTQSDEITLVLTDYADLKTDAWFDYRLDKICSVAASMATSAFNMSWSNEADAHELDENEGNEEERKYSKVLELNRFLAEFDARAFNVPKEEACNCILWRQQDAERNSIQGLAQSLYSHKQLHGISTKRLQDKMFNEKGVNWNELPTHKKRGTACIREAKEVEDTYNSLSEEISYVTRHFWILDENMPILKGEDRNYVEKLI
jgi:tRNA(His) 5'-end guanylyltransferase